MASNIYDYPTSQRIEEIEQILLPRLTADSPVFRMFPFEGVPETVLKWEQYDNFQGMQQIRGLNGKPSRVAPIGIKQYMQMPGYYGEFMPIDEAELTQRRAIGTFGTPVDISDLVRQKQDQLLTRRLQRQEYMLWQLVVNGYFFSTDVRGVIIHVDGYTQQQYTPTTLWSDTANSLPLHDIRNIQATFHLGQSVSFGSDAKMWMNRVTANTLLANTNNADFFGRRAVGLTTINSIKMLNELLLGEDLPQIAVYDDFYLSDGTDGNTANTAIRYIPTGKVIVEGRRLSGTPVGKFRYTRNVNNPDGSPTPYMRVIDRGEDQVPREVEVHDGFNGGPVLYFPGCLVKINAY